MKSICFCFQLHIPIILRNYRFFEIGQNHTYFDVVRAESHIKQKTKNVLLPFLGMLQLLHQKTNGKFKAGIAISGTTLQLLQKSAPEVIKHLKKLLQNNCIEFLSEPWTHSLLPYTSKKLLKQEIRRHDNLIQELFGVRPKVLFAYAPNNSFSLLSSAIEDHTNGIITSANSLPVEKKGKNDITPHLTDDRRIVLIDEKNSQIFGKIDFDPNIQTLVFYTSELLERINRNALSNCPSVIVFNPVQKNKPFNRNLVIIWKTIIQQMLNFYQIQFLHPSQIVEPSRRPISDTDGSEKSLQHYRFTDFWLHSKIQREVFTKQKVLNTLLKQTSSTPLHSVWENVQDMDNLFFMNDHFLKESFAANYFNPYASPYLAYINYMNVLEDIYTSLLKETGRPGHLPEIRKKNKYVAAY